MVVSLRAVAVALALCLPAVAAHASANHSRAEERFEQAQQKADEAVEKVVALREATRHNADKATIEAHVKAWEESAIKEANTTLSHLAAQFESNASALQSVMAKGPNATASQRREGYRLLSNMHGLDRKLRHAEQEQWRTARHGAIELEDGARQRARRVRHEADNLTREAENAAWELDNAARTVGKDSHADSIARRVEDASRAAESEAEEAARATEFRARESSEKVHDSIKRARQQVRDKTLEEAEDAVALAEVEDVSSTMTPLAAALAALFAGAAGAVAAAGATRWHRQGSVQQALLTA